MPQITIGFGLILIFLGLAGYFGSGMVSITALIPTFFGLPMAALGLAAMSERMRKHSMHGAAALALIGLLGTLKGAIGFIVLMQGGNVLRPGAVKVQAIMATLCLVFLGLCVNSFIQARRAQSEPAGE